MEYDAKCKIQTEEDYCKIEFSSTLLDICPIDTDFQAVHSV